MELAEIKAKITPILQKHSIRRAGLFGSVITGNATDESDIDVLVELGSKVSLLEFVRIKLELEDQLKTKVDLVEYQALKPRLKDRILSEEIRIYG
ncbi:MAG: nucleotidyltransferase family protein [Bacteroidota bacterium]